MGDWTGSLCSMCGFDVRMDEDGCCATCGCPAVGTGVEEALEIRRNLLLAIRQRNKLGARITEALHAMEEAEVPPTPGYVLKILRGEA